MVAEVVGSLNTLINRFFPQIGPAAVDIPTLLAAAYQAITAGLRDSSPVAGLAGGEWTHVAARLDPMAGLVP